MKNDNMITINITYTGNGRDAKKFMKEMIDTGIVDKIRKEPGNLRYNYYLPVDDPHSVLLIDSWENQEALDKHHASSMMKAISDLREKYDVHMKIECFFKEDDDTDKTYVR